MKKTTIIYITLFFLLSCSSESESGQAVGFISHFTSSGLLWKSWEVELNKSATGMTSTAQELDLSIDNDHQDQNLVNQLDSAQKYGWKVQIDYEQHFGTNCANNRGNTSRFIKTIKILDKNPIGNEFGGDRATPAKIKDTVYVIILNK